MPGRNSQVSRFYCILNILEASNQGLTADQIWERVNDAGHSASKRTIYRDIVALQQSGFPLSNPNTPDSDGAQKWKLERHAKITENFILNPKELLALFLARGVLTPLRDTPFYSDLESIFKKIESRIDGKAREHLSELMGDFHFDPLPKWGLGLDPDTVETIRAASSEKQVLGVTYASVAGKDKRDRKLGPHFLYFAKGSLYLVAEDLEDKTVKVWSAARMSDAKLLDEPYEKPAIDPSQYFKSAFGVFIGGKAETVKLEFAPIIAPFVKERGWHPTQKIVTKGDGSILFEMEVSLTSEVVQWVLGFGTQVKVIEPVSLKRLLLANARDLEALYRHEITCEGCFDSLCTQFKQDFFKIVPEFTQKTKDTASDLFSLLIAPLLQQKQQKASRFDSQNIIDLDDFRTTSEQDYWAPYRARFGQWLQTVGLLAELTVPPDAFLGRSKITLSTFTQKDSSGTEWVLITHPFICRIKKSSLLSVPESSLKPNPFVEENTGEGKCMGICKLLAKTG